MSLYSDTVALIGWHRHVNAWVWGVCSQDGCDLCDRIERWLNTQPNRGFDIDWQEAVKQEIRLRREIMLPQPTVFVDPHEPREVPKEETPSMDKIERKKKTKVVEEKPKPPQEELVLSVAAVSVQEDKIEDEPPPPPVVQQPTFKLTNPDEFTLKKVRRRR